MKKIFLLAGLSLLLAGCNDKDKTTPTASVNLSGTWSVASVQAGYSSTSTMVISQTSINAAGDYVGTLTADGNTASLAGNINQGTFNMTIPSEGTAACKGTFSNNYTKYVGHCTTPGSSDADITMTKN